jgi:hypothetical protein
VLGFFAGSAAKLAPHERKMIDALKANVASVFMKFFRLGACHFDGLVIEYIWLASPQEGPIHPVESLARL